MKGIFLGLGKGENKYRGIVFSLEGFSLNPPKIAGGGGYEFCIYPSIRSEGSFQ